MTQAYDLARAYLIQRRGMSLLAAAFPVVFLVSSVILRRTCFQDSISAYYWTRNFERNIFVGVLCAVAAFLILYKGRTWIEDRLLDLAGACAAGIALFPMIIRMPLPAPSMCVAADKDH